MVIVLVQSFGVWDPLSVRRHATLQAFLILLPNLVLDMSPHQTQMSKYRYLF